MGLGAQAAVNKGESNPATIRGIPAELSASRIEAAALLELSESFS
jgi:hypothetical protein